MVMCFWIKIRVCCRIPEPYCTTTSQKNHFRSTTTETTHSVGRRIPRRKNRRHAAWGPCVGMPGWSFAVTCFFFWGYMVLWILGLSLLESMNWESRSQPVRWEFWMVQHQSPQSIYLTNVDFGVNVYILFPYFRIKGVRIDRTGDVKGVLWPDLCICGY